MQCWPVWAAVPMPSAAFYNFIEDKDVQLIGCEAAGRGVNTAETAATIATGSLEFSMA